jgi:phage repressor protein C with HTH and peptisase S24 domain
MDINQLRIEALKKLIGGRKTKDFAEQHDLDASYLSQMLNGHRPMGEKAARNLEAKIGLPAGALTAPTPPSETGAYTIAETRLEPGPDLTRPFKRTRILGIAQLGPDGYWDALAVADGWLDVPTTDPDAYSLRVKGDSMAPAIRSGWVVWCEPNHQLIPGEYVMVRCVDGQSMVKELLFENAEEVSLMAVNATYGRITIPRSDIEQIHYVGGIVPPSKIKY